MRNSIQFKPVHFQAFVPSMLTATVECHDCGLRRTVYGAITHAWRMVDREIGPDVFITDYICAECCEARVHDYNQLVADAADDL